MAWHVDGRLGATHAKRFFPERTCARAARDGEFGDRYPGVTEGDRDAGGCSKLPVPVHFIAMGLIDCTAGRAGNLRDSGCPFHDLSGVSVDGHLFSLVFRLSGGAQAPSCRSFSGASRLSAARIGARSWSTNDGLLPLIKGIPGAILPILFQVVGFCCVSKLTCCTCSTLVHGPYGILVASDAEPMDTNCCRQPPAPCALSGDNSKSLWRLRGAGRGSQVHRTPV
jgi:hypothetical protein